LDGVSRNKQNKLCAGLSFEKNKYHYQYTVYAAFADSLLTNSFIFSVEKDLGRSMGRPRPRSQTKEANTPRARDTPNNTV